MLPEIEEVDSIEIRKEDLRVDTFRSSGAGGQHVNTTDSAVRLTHLPTGIVVECQDERLQHKNRARAMSLLQAKLLSAEQESQRASQASERRLLVGSGDRSERIRTYNFPQGRITDHRINLTLYKLDEVVGGELDADCSATSRASGGFAGSDGRGMTTRELLQSVEIDLSRCGALLAHVLDVDRGGKVDRSRG